MKNNLQIRGAIASAGMNMYQVAEALGYTESGFSRMLRKELSERDRDIILKAINKIKERTNL